MEGRQILPVRLENTKEQREAAEIPDVGHENQVAIDHFLDDLVGNTSEVRDENVVRKGVLTARQGQHGKILESVMRDLGLLNMTDEEVTAALCKYRRCRHILIDDETIKQMRDVEDDFKGGATQTDGHMKDIPTRTRTLGIPDRDETLEEFSQRHDKFCRVVEDIFIYDGELVQLSQNHRRPKISVQSLDNLLGIAGFRPEKGLGLFPDKNLEVQTPKTEASKEEVLNETWDHIRVERIGSEFCAEVSLKPFSRFATQDHDMNDIYQHLVTIISIYSRVGKVMEKLQSIGSLGNEIVYLKRRGAAAGRRLGLVDTEEADLDLADGFIIETVSLNMETLNELLATVNNFYDKFQKFSDKAGANRGWFWSALAAVVVVGNHIALFLGLPGLIALGVMALIKSFASGWGSATHDERMAAVSDLGEHARPILAQLQLPTVQTSPVSASILQQDISTLHKIALTGQFLSLILQSHVRGSKAPFDFEDFVDCPVSCFRLRGIDPNAPSIYAFTQKLSCFPDQKVLVFDTTKINSSSGLQLRTSPAHMMILWQPINVIIQTKDARDDGTSCSGLVAMGGIIIPNETPGTSLRLWRWSEPRNLNAKMLCGRRMPGVGLHDRILLESYHDSDANQQEPGLIETLNPPMGHDADSEHITTASTAPSTQEKVQATEDFSLGTTIRAGVQDVERDKVHLPRSATEGSFVSCPWDTDEAEAKRKSRMSECLCQSGTVPGFLQLENIQAGAQAQTGIIPVGAQIVATLRCGPDTTLKTTLLGKESGLIGDLDEYCCVFLSLHTGVVERVRLRDMVAYFATSRLVDAAVCGVSLNEIIPILMSDEDVLKRIESKENKSELNTHLNQLIRQVLHKLKNSGISRRKDLVILWPGRQTKQLKISRRMEKWVPILSDTLTTSTFACMIPTCKETEEYKCPMAQSSAGSQQAIEWNFPDKLRLKTTLLGSKKLKRKPQEKTQLLPGKAYWINDPRLSLIAVVLGSAKPRKDKLVFYLSVRSTMVPGFLMKHFTAYPTVREDKEVSSFDCVLGSGDEFEREVQIYLEQTNSGDETVENRNRSIKPSTNIR